MKNKIDILKKVQSELERFQSKLLLAIEEQSYPKNYSNKNYTSFKRKALDLKNELTKLTQDSKYLWNKNK